MQENHIQPTAVSSMQTNPTQMPPNNSFSTTLAQQNNNISQLLQNNSNFQTSTINTSMNQSQSQTNLSTISTLSPMSNKTDPINSNLSSQDNLKQSQQLQQQLQGNNNNNNNNNTSNKQNPSAGQQLNPLSGLMGIGGGMSTDSGTNGGNNIISALDKSLDGVTSMASMVSDKSSVMSILPNFDDPVEQSLASLEQSSVKCDIDTTLHNVELLSMNQTLMQQLGYDNVHHDNSNNGFGMDTSMGINGTGVPVSGSGILGMSLPSMSQSSSMSQSTPMSQSIFDGMLSSVPRSMSAGMSMSNSMPATSIGFGNVTSTPIANNAGGTNSNLGSSLGGNGITNITNPGGFRPKPIEDLMMPSSNDKKTPPPDLKTNLSNAINKSMDPNIKNAIASSWSSLASAGSPQNTPTSHKPKQPAMDSFQQFRNKAKEKADRQKLLEQQELRRSNKEAAEKRQQEQNKLKRDEVDSVR